MPLGKDASASVDRVEISSDAHWTAELRFWLFISLSFLCAFVAAPYPETARWLGFFFAAYAAVANDSIQTLGTFIASNKHRPWWMLWLFAGSVFFVTVLYSWLSPVSTGEEIGLHTETILGATISYGGDVSTGRLFSKGFESSPTSFSFLQVAAPIFLIILTRLKMPVSTTFLLLTSFSTEVKGVMAVLEKSLTGYFLAFAIGLLVWVGLQKKIEQWFTGKAHPVWSIFQWITTGTLWSVWIMQDAANIAVYLPRALSFYEFAAFALVIILGLGWMFRMGGEKIQEVVDEKSSVVDVRVATIIDFFYAIILFYFKMYNQVPMSTTWVFLGLLGGRELGIALRSKEFRSPKEAVSMITKDASFAGIGLVVSFVIAIAVNQSLL